MMNDVGFEFEVSSVVCVCVCGFVGEYRGKSVLEIAI